MQVQITRSWSTTLREALIEPARIVQPADVPEHCGVCFFREVLEKVVVEHNARMLAENRWEDGPHPLFEIAHRGKRLASFAR